MLSWPLLGPGSQVPEKELALLGTRDLSPSDLGPGSQVPEKELAPLGTWDLRPRVPEKELAPNNIIQWVLVSTKMQF